MKFPFWKITNQIFTDRKGAGRYLNFREPLRTLECPGLHPLIGQASQKGSSAASVQRRCPWLPAMRESATIQWPHLPRSPRHFWRNDIRSCCPGWVRTGRAQMQPRATPQALSAAPSSTLCPLIAAVAVSFGLHSVPRVEQSLRKWLPWTQEVCARPTGSELPDNKSTHDPSLESLFLSGKIAVTRKHTWFSISSHHGADFGTAV